MKQNREIIEARIVNFLKRLHGPDYKVINARTRWIGNRGEESNYDVRYFITSTRFSGGVRHERVGVLDNTVRILYDDI